VELFDLLKEIKTNMHTWSHSFSWSNTIYTTQYGFMFDIPW